MKFIRLESVESVNFSSLLLRYLLYWLMRRSWNFFVINRLVYRNSVQFDFKRDSPEGFGCCCSLKTGRFFAFARPEFELLCHCGTLIWDDFHNMICEITGGDCYCFSCFFSRVWLWNGKNHNTIEFHSLTSAETDSRCTFFFCSLITLSTSIAKCLKEEFCAKYFYRCF